MVRVYGPQGLATTPSSSPFGSSDCSDPVLLPADGPRRLRLRKLKPYLYTVGVRVTVLRCWKLNVIVRSIYQIGVSHALQKCGAILNLKLNIPLIF
jgi:hypothetical protein